MQLFDLGTGAPVASFDVGSMSFRFRDNVILDRWVPFTAEDSRGLLLDCVTAQLVEFAPPNSVQVELDISIAGAYMLHQIPGVADAIVVRLTDGPGGATALEEVAHIALSGCNSRIAMCERGRSYLLFDRHGGTLHLIDLATRQPKRAFVPRASPWRCCMRRLTRCSYSCRH